MTASPFVPEQLERKDASGQIARQLRRAISEGQWAPGERLPSELELGETFDVSRATAREALKLLSATGLVQSAAGAMEARSSRFRMRRRSPSNSATRSGSGTGRATCR